MTMFLTVLRESVILAAVVVADDKHCNKSAYLRRSIVFERVKLLSIANNAAIF